MAFQLPQLPYALNALEPYITQLTMEFHYGKHHESYVDKLNELINGTPYEFMTLEQIMEKSKTHEPDIFNNAAQSWNHDFFWKCLTPNASEASDEFKQKINDSFGSFENLKEEFTKEGKEFFGSGWIWLVKDHSEKLCIQSTQNARNPLLKGETPLLVCDVWEHAYYLDYQNEREKFLEQFWNLINWEFVERNDHFNDSPQAELH